MMDDGIHLDFETASVVPLRGKDSLGVWIYARHPSTHILSLAYKVPGGKLTLWTPGDDLPYDLFDAIEAGHALSAFNANFERLIWRWQCVDKMGWPPVFDAAWDCLEARGAHRALPGDLDLVGEVLELDHQKDKRGKYLVNTLCKPRKPTKNNPDIWNRDPDLMEELYRYNGHDVLTDMDLAAVVPPLPISEQRVYNLDTQINSRGVYIDVPAVDGAIAIRDEAFALMSQEMFEVTGGAVKDLNDTAGLREYLGVGSVSKGELEMFLEEPGLPPEWVRAVELRQKGGLSSVKKLEKMRGVADPDDNRARFLFRYHAATTGRWSSGLIQSQNMPSPPDDFEPDFELLARANYDDYAAKFPDVMEGIKYSLRGFLSSPPGKVLNAADFSGIESRVLAWIAGEEWKLDIMRRADRGETKESYLHTADAIYGREITDKKSPERKVAKTADLACGYQGWIGAFDKLGGDKLGLDDEEKKGIILSWRKKHERTTLLWKALEEASVECVETGKPQTVGPFTFRLELPWMTVEMPSGSKLYYYNPRVVAKTGYRGDYLAVRFDAYKVPKGGSGRIWASVDGYGGLYTENFVQKIARDLLVHAMFLAEDNGYPIVVHVHDELVTEVPEFMSDVAGLEQIMCEVPAWATGLPLNSAGWEGKRFTK